MTRRPRLTLIHGSPTAPGSAPAGESATAHRPRVVDEPAPPSPPCQAAARVLRARRAAVAERLLSVQAELDECLPALVAASAALAEARALATWDGHEMALALALARSLARLDTLVGSAGIAAEELAPLVFGGPDRPRPPAPGRAA